MMKRLLERKSGLGAIHADGLLLRATRYNLSIWSDDQHGADPKAIASIDGHIDLTGMGEAVVLAGPANLTLTIEDGRRLAFQLTNTAGGIASRGWLP
jgi:hypothetical protein